jgi:hypothetical protein
MHLHAREIRFYVYQTIKWHLLKQADLPRSPWRLFPDAKRREIVGVKGDNKLVLSEYPVNKCAEAGRFASLSVEDFEFNLVDQFFKLVRIVAKTCLLLIFFS